MFHVCQWDQVLGMQLGDDAEPSVLRNRQMKYSVPRRAGHALDNPACAGSMTVISDSGGGARVAGFG